MKKALKTSLLLAVSALYVLVASIYGNNAAVDHLAFSQSESETEQYLSIVSTNLFCPITKTENSISSPNNLPTTSAKKNHGDFSISIKAKEQLFLSVFSQYTLFSQNLLVRLQKTELIFPFHYFW